LHSTNPKTHLRRSGFPEANVSAIMSFQMNGLADSLLTDAQRAQLRRNDAARANDRNIDPYPVVKLITLDAHATWLLSELASDGDTAYGLIDLGLGVPELGHVRLSDLASIRGPNGIPVRRDLHFTARRTLSEYARQAIEDGSIND